MSTENVVPLNAPQALKCNGCGRDKDHDRALAFYFNRKITNDEMRYLHEVMERACALMPA